MLCYQVSCKLIVDTTEQLFYNKKQLNKVDLSNVAKISKKVATFANYAALENGLK